MFEVLMANTYFSLNFTSAVLKVWATDLVRESFPEHPTDYVCLS